MDLFTVAIVALVPCVVLGFIFYFLVQKYVEQENKKASYKLKESARQTLLPIKLQAYERLVILLERIRLNNLAIRVAKPGMNSQYLQRDMLNIIRTEFDHNQSQQLYISEKAWRMVQASKEQSITLMKIVSDKVDAEESGAMFTKVIVEMAGRPEYNAVDAAIAFLRKEMNSFY